MPSSTLMTAAEAPQKYPHAKFWMEADGTLSNKRMEQYALLVADYVPQLTAWRATSPTNSNNRGGRYRDDVHKNGHFKDRLATLLARHEMLEEKGPWGKLLWQAEQLYAHYAARNDVNGMARATEMAMKLVDRMERPDRGEDTGVSRRGAPAIDSEVPAPTEPDLTSPMRRRLLEKPVAQDA